MGAFLIANAFLKKFQMLKRILYTSKASHVMGTLAIFRLLTESRIKNQKFEITGHLLFDENHFLQCFEGPAQNVDNLWLCVKRDYRHYNVELMLNKEVTQRKFSDWSMGLTTYKSLLTHGLEGCYEIDENSLTNFTTHCLSD